MKYYIIAGEASGDLHASNLMKEIKSLDNIAEFRCWGGDLMREQGGELVMHYKDIAYMGFVEVLAHMGTILKNIKFCKKDILQYKPDALILLDYPGFNLRIAEFAKKEGFKVLYYISPQVWAWKQSRVKKIKQIVDRIYVILPFEKAFYKKFGYDVDFVGHPLLDAIERSDSESSESFIEKNKLDNKPIIALVPGSRKQEITKMLPVMLTVIPSFKEYQFVIAGSPAVPAEFYQGIIKGSDVKIVYNQTYELLRNTHAALVTSGTATLETALFEVPEVVCYKGTYVSYLIAKSFIKVKFISLVNLIMDREIVRELIQKQFNAENLKLELERLISDDEKRTLLFKEYKELKEKLGGKGASQKTAALMLNRL